MTFKRAPRRKRRGFRIGYTLFSFFLQIEAFYAKLKSKQIYIKNIQRNQTHGYECAICWVLFLFCLEEKAAISWSTFLTIKLDNVGLM